MRPTTHVVTLSGGSLTLPLGMVALRALANVTAEPKRPELGCVDPAKVVRGEQSLSMLTMCETMAALAGSPHTAESVFGMGTYLEVSASLAGYFLTMVKAMGPDKPQEGTPKGR